SSLLNATGSQAIVDWVLLELRNNDAGHTVAARRAALLRANGQVVSTSGEDQIAFSTNPVGKRLVIRHRNHLGVMTSATITSNGQVIDFTAAGTSLFGSNGLKVNGSYRAMWPGDVNSDGNVVYTGSANDRDPVLSTIGGAVATNTVNAYSRSDVNLDGVVKYSGTDNDRDIVLEVIGGAVPTTVRQAQLP
ncbi:MAG TPA: hypothetical protein PL070_08050, partial [Flavobacteriales bacterium]|nr:hypothetical protein [Flavobacteriales bacterium]